MGQHTTIAETGAAVGAIEFIGIKNFISAFCAFYTTIDELKHRRFLPGRQNNARLVMTVEGTAQRTPSSRHPVMLVIVTSTEVSPHPSYLTMWITQPPPHTGSYSMRVVGVKKKAGD
jgi:hypothetical protein